MGILGWDKNFERVWACARVITQEGRQSAQSASNTSALALAAGTSDTTGAVWTLGRPDHCQSTSECEVLGDYLQDQGQSCRSVLGEIYNDLLIARG